MIIRAMATVLVDMPLRVTFSEDVPMVDYLKSAANAAREIISKGIVVDGEEVKAQPITIKLMVLEGL